MDWKVEGDVVEPFGVHRNPVLGTLTRNSGVTLCSPAGDTIRAPFAGAIHRTLLVDAPALILVGQPGSIVLKGLDSLPSLGDSAQVGQALALAPRHAWELQVRQGRSLDASDPTGFVRSPSRAARCEEERSP